MLHRAGVGQLLRVRTLGGCDDLARNTAFEASILGRRDRRRFRIIQRIPALVVVEGAAVSLRLTGKVRDLLRDMGELVGNELPAVAAAGGELAAAEGNVIAPRVGARGDPRRGGGGAGMGVQADGGKVVAETRLEIGPLGGG